MKRPYTLALLILVTGCSFFSRPENRFFTLEVIAPEARVSTSFNAVAINAVELPPGLDRRGIVIGSEENGVEIRETDQWTDTLENHVLHTLAHNLGQRLPEGVMILPGETVREAPVLIDVIFEKLLAGPESKMEVVARVSIAGSASTERVTIEMGSLDSGEVAEATSAALAELASRIAAKLSS